MKQVTIYTDGCAIPNPGASGAGIVLCYGKTTKTLSVKLGEGTSNTAEVLAIVHALEALKEPCQVTIYSDSQYAVNCGNREWHRSSNIDIWKQFDLAAARHEVKLCWIRKDTHPLNMQAHELANEAVNS